MHIPSKPALMGRAQAARAALRRGATCGTRCRRSWSTSTSPQRRSIRWAGLSGWGSWMWLLGGSGHWVGLLMGPLGGSCMKVVPLDPTVGLVSGLGPLGAAPACGGGPRMEPLGWACEGSPLVRPYPGSRDMPWLSRNGVWRGRGEGGAVSSPGQACIWCCVGDGWSLILWWAVGSVPLVCGCHI